jgi:two-component system sensor histidine kinase TrcS
MLGVAALVTAVALGVGALSIYTLRGYAETVVDLEVQHSLRAFGHSLAESRAMGAQTPIADFTGQSAGTVTALLSGQRITDSASFGDEGGDPAPPAAVAALQAVDWQDPGPRNVDLGPLGECRVASEDLGNGERLISAVSLRDAQQAITNKTAGVAIITALAALLAGIGTVVLVRRTLTPLRRVAATAARAATIPVNDDAHRISARVRYADSDPDSEVGIVGETLNRLLANVDSALAARAESDRRMRQFLSDASHELRTPLAAIRGYAELTRQDGPALPETTEYALARIESESRRMASLVDDMLLLSRLDERRGLQTELLDLCDLVADAVNDVAVTAPEHRFAAVLPDDPVWIQGDRARLHQVVINLLANSCVHTPPGVTVTTTIRVPAGAASPMVELEVSDDGPGIAPEMISNLFGRFVRADKARSRAMESTGLGLAIVAAITEAHGGTVDVRSVPGATDFVVRLPTGTGPSTHESDVKRNQTLRDRDACRGMDYEYSTAVDVPH